MDTFLQQLVNGVSLGSIYALIALGYTMVYGIIKLINFAHGEVYMIGAFIGYAIPNLTGLGFFPALLISMGACSLLGFTIEKIAYKPLRHSSRITRKHNRICRSLLYGGSVGRGRKTSCRSCVFPHIKRHNMGSDAPQRRFFVRVN